MAMRKRTGRCLRSEIQRRHAPKATDSESDLEDGTSGWIKTKQVKSIENENENVSDKETKAVMRDRWL